ncbi:proprotein convertase subtilisin/kexin type 9-like [Saccoglossus kowalevskii]|uniref:Proprotein convertase subtilisin/kexin type 9-like n=1 Tax=Saccoglossus kowalevskii TaxID=10224 RepID=A0ABM0GJH9_SACKO|nr:PREDICTED: proprotein convertase subtilisin/kexin type 9-like [Saccoglossus kowalevskii]
MNIAFCVCVVLTVVCVSTVCGEEGEWCIVCTTRVSELSGTGDDDKSEVQCKSGEVMTGCSSYSPGKGHGKRDGEFFKTDTNGNAVCVAQNGYKGTGVYAYARCCHWPKMTCQYVKGEQSETSDDAISIAQCPDVIDCMSASVTGCAVHTYWQNLDGTQPNVPSYPTELTDITDNYCYGVNGYSGKGVTGHAACCGAPGLKCKAKFSEQVKNAEAKVKCDDGWILTGCSVRTSWKETDGAYIDDDDNCIAAGTDKLWAVAVCCKTG